MKYNIYKSNELIIQTCKITQIHAHFHSKRPQYRCEICLFRYFYLYLMLSIAVWKYNTLTSFGGFFVLKQSITLQKVRL